MARIAVGGWQHETNTFSPQLATYEAFMKADEWPALASSEAMFASVDGVHLPITGAIEVLREAGHQLVPLLWCAAGPCSYVTKDAFEQISVQLIAALDAALLDGAIDGIYLDLHGAMVTEEYEDGEGEILKRIRDVVGDELPIAVSLDMHANVTEEMLAQASVLDIFRTYPHIDMGETGARTAEHLLKILAGEQWYKALKKTEYLVPLNWGCTVTEPTASIYRKLPNLIGDGVHCAAMAVGFHLSDIAEAGPGVVAYADSQALADKAATKMIDWFNLEQENFRGEVLMEDEGVARAMTLKEGLDGPVILADTQDNPGGGGTGDTVGILRELIVQKAVGAVVATIADIEVAVAAHQAGKAALIDVCLGGKVMPQQLPLKAKAKVLKLGDGCVVATGPMYKGARMQLGLMALLEIEGILVIVTSTKVQVADQSILRSMGLEPSEQSIISLKSSVHFRNDFQPLAGAIIIIKSPGAVVVEPKDLDYRHAVLR